MKSDDLAKMYNEGQVQYSYFLIAAAGAAIGYTINKLDGPGPATIMMIPGIVALVCWLVSFINGGLYVSAGLKALGSQHILFELNEGIEPPRLHRRLPILRRWSHDKANVFQGSSRASGAHGARAST